MLAIEIRTQYLELAQTKQKQGYPEESANMLNVAKIYSDLYSIRMPDLYSSLDDRRIYNAKMFNRN